MAASTCSPGEASLPADDRLLVRNLLARGIVGLNDWEREG
jgi:hypothetical protein